ncbi:ead/Ea22-like family protein [Escherichia coli]|nr:ead/Ea22-like family protein [Escherichia coli]MDV1752051.1 ead/Ea22-like family protein [Escherichia coli]
MSKINYQALREAAEKATWGDWDSYKPHRGARGYEVRLSSQAIAQHVLKNNAEFIAAFNPKIALALLDERERNQQYIKLRDQENEDIALTVGRLLIENGQLVADTLRHLADNEIDSDYFAITSTNENGTEIDHEMAITDYALQAAGTVAELVADLESAEKRIAELEAEPVSQTYKSQHTQFEQVADLYEMQFDDGRTCAFHTDAQKAAQWLQACDGNRVQEYVKLERLQNALSGNSPVTPDGWISCSERMPVIGELNWRTSFPLLVTCEIGVIPAYYGFVSINGERHYGFMESLKYGDDSGNHPQTNEYDLISNVTHWMPLPEPPQEVNRG